MIDKSGKIFSDNLQVFDTRFLLRNGSIITEKIGDDKKSKEWGYIAKNGKYKVIPTQNIDWIFRKR